jgi:hypothetical protein
MAKDAALRHNFSPNGFDFDKFIPYIMDFESYGSFIGELITGSVANVCKWCVTKKVTKHGRR